MPTPRSPVLLPAPSPQRERCRARLVSRPTRLALASGLRALAGPALPPSAAQSQGARASPPDVTAVQSAQRRLIESRPSSRSLGGEGTAVRRPAAGRAQPGTPRPRTRSSPRLPRQTGQARLTWTIKLGAAASSPLSPPPPSDRRASRWVQAGDVLPG